MLAASLFVLAFSTGAYVSEEYTITSSDGKTSYTEVAFGGDKEGEMLTAFDPESKKFVYLYWKRSEARPKPVAKIWDHRTGETIALYKFPGVTQPLPEIKSIKDIKCFPLTTDKNFKVVQTGSGD